VRGCVAGCVGMYACVCVHRCVAGCVQVWGLVCVWGFVSASGCVHVFACVYMLGNQVAGLSVLAARPQERLTRFTYVSLRVSCVAVPVCPPACLPAHLSACPLRRCAPASKTRCTTASCPPCWPSWTGWRAGAGWCSLARQTGRTPSTQHSGALEGVCLRLRLRLLGPQTHRHSALQYLCLFGSTKCADFHGLEANRRICLRLFDLHISQV
jgi:hypothetical protein